jgi:hypothetical protein
MPRGAARPSLGPWAWEPSPLALGKPKRVAGDPLKSTVPGQSRPTAKGEAAGP